MNNNISYSESVEFIEQLIKKQSCDAIFSNYILNPKILTETWHQFGNTVKSKENEMRNANASEWISLRLDGVGFSVLTKKLRSFNIISKGYSVDFANIMQNLAKFLLTKLGGFCVFTQSDEITLIIPPISTGPNQDQNPNNCHLYNGRVLKLCSTTASIASIYFYRQLLKLSASLILDDIYPHFDCRMGVYSTQKEAFGVIWWRAYDCSINGVADAVYQIRGRLHKQENTFDRLKWLEENNYLPLPEHQAYGSFYARVKKIKDGHNPLTGETKKCLRPAIEKMDGPVLHRVRDNSLIPNNDKLE